MTANTIPVEILHQIISLLPISDLPNVSLISPHWYGPSQEALYHTLHLFPVSLMLFARTLVTPGLDNLASHVRTLSITWQTSPAETVENADLARFDAAAAAHGIRLPRSTSNDLVELLLHLLPRVNTLELSPPDSASGANDFLDVTPPGLHLPLGLRSLRSLSCTWPSHTRGVSTGLLLSLLSQPHLRTLTVDLLDDADSGVLFAQGTSGITTLHIRHTHIAFPNLPGILAAPRALEHLSLTAMSPADEAGLTRLYEALEPLRETLHVLEIRLDRGNRAWSVNMIPAAPPPASFGDWPVLHTLRCPLRLLQGNTTVTSA